MPGLLPPIKTKVAPESATRFATDHLYARLRRRRNTPKPTRAEPRRASEAGSGVLGGVTAPTTMLSLQLIAPAVLPLTGCWQLCASVTVVPRLKPAGAAVMVPVSVSPIKPVVLVAKTVDVSTFNVCEVKVNVKPPTEMATLIEAGGAFNMVKLAGLIVVGELAAIPKFPVDAELVPGLTTVFIVVFDAMRGPLSTVVMPPFPGVNVKVPEATTAYA